MVVSPGQQRHQLKRASTQHAGFQPGERHLKPFTSSPLRVFVGILSVASGPPAMTCHLPALHAEKLPRRNGSRGSWVRAEAGLRCSFPIPLGGSALTFAPRALGEAEQSTSQLLSQGGSRGGGALMAPGCSVLPGAASQVTARRTWKETQTKHQGITSAPPAHTPPGPRRKVGPQAAPMPPVKGAPWTPFAG